MRIHRFARLGVGDETFVAPLMEVGTIRGTDADMLLGFDYMRTRRFWLSYASRTVFIQHPGPVRPAPGP